MAVTIAAAADAPGRAATRPALTGNARPIKISNYTITFDNSYPTGGELITSVFNDFQEVLGIFPHGLNTRIVEADYTNKKLKLFTAMNTEAANASDQSTIVTRILVIGYK